MQAQKEEKEKSEERKEIDLFFNLAQISGLMTKKNEPTASQAPGGGGGGPTSNGTATATTVSPATTTTTTMSTGVMIVQQLPIGEQQHYVLPAVNNPAPMIFTTPLGTTSATSLPRSFASLPISLSLFQPFHRSSLNNYRQHRIQRRFPFQRVIPLL